MERRASSLALPTSGMTSEQKFWDWYVLIEMFAPEPQIEGARYLLSELPDLFDRLTAKLPKLVIS
jgi:hypothetical protein